MKKISLLFLFLSFFSLSLFSQEFESFDTSDSEESFDDFDSIFEDAEDLEEPVLDDEEQSATPVQIAASAFSSFVHFSGSFSGEVGALYIHKKNEDENAEEEFDDDVSGFFSLKNTLNMSIIPSSIFSVRGSLYTGIDNGFNINVSSLYFNYLLLDRIYISAGKKGISWGNIRLFNSGYYGSGTHSGGLYCTGPQYANIFSEDGVPLALDIKYPWTWGTLTFAVTGNSSTPVKPKNFNYYGSLEFSVLNTNFNLYAKRPAKNTNPIRNNLFGLEIKRTILGFDTYAQGLVRIKDIKNLKHKEAYEYVVATAGLYRLFDSFDPNIGFNLEYQYEFKPDSEKIHYNRLAFEGGLKRIGNKKNMKIGLLSHYTITDNHGFSALNFIISGVLPYADWSNKIAVGYGSKYASPTIMLSSSISLALDY